MLRCSLLCVMVILGLHVSFALFEDQAGVLDWHRHLIGEVKFAAFSTESRQRFIFVGTKQNVIAALGPRTGNLAWRQVLPESEILNQLHYEANVLVSVSNDGSVIRAWNPTDGSLYWDRGTTSALPSSSNSNSNSNPKKCDVYVTADGNRREVLVGTPKAVMLLENKGTERWMFNQPDGFSSIHLIGATSTAIYVLAVKLDGTAVRFSLSPTSGSVVSSTTLGERFPSSDIQGLSRPSLGWFATVTASEIVIAPSLGSALVRQSLQGFLSDYTVADGALTIEDIGYPQGFAVRSSITNKRWVVVVDSIKTPFSLRVVHGPFRAAQASALINRQNQWGVVSAILSEDGQLATEWTPLTRSTSASETTVLVSGIALAGRGGIARVWSAAAATAAQSIGAVETLIQTSDGTLMLVASPGQGGKKITWERHEALAEIQQAEMVRLSTPQAARGASLSEFIQRVQLQLQSTADWILDSIQSVQNLVSAQKTTSTRKARSLNEDDFGFRKLIIAQTRPGTLFGLDTLDGSVVWKTYLPSAVQLPEHASIVSTRALHCSSSSSGSASSAAASSSSGAQCWVIVETDQRTTAVLSLRTMNGQVSVQTTLPFLVKEILSLPASLLQTSSQTAPVLAVVSSLDDTVHIVSDSSASASAIRTQLAQHVQTAGLNIFRADQEAGVLEGLVIQHADWQTQTNARLSTAWRISFARDVERIAAVGRAQQPEAVQSAVQLIGGATMFKNLNPNLVVVATVRSRPLPGMRTLPGVKRTGDPSLHLYLIDRVTGAILQDIVQPGGAGPVRLAVSENRVVAHYWNQQSLQFEITALELFEDRNDPAFDTDGPTFSSRSSLPPVVNMQTFVFGAAVRALATTSTQRGITPKSFLAALSSGQILHIPRPLLDPRRPLEDPTPQLQAEGLVPYSREILADPLMMASYNITVANPKRFAVSHALLESTCLVLAYGLDLFFTRLTPADAFDMLSPDFNYLFLVLTVSLAGLAIPISRFLANRRLNHSALDIMRPPPRRPAAAQRNADDEEEDQQLQEDAQEQDEEEEEQNLRQAQQQTRQRVVRRG